ncbi:MAG: DUF4926 domain-containing protein [Bacteroidetes bacterium]|nr:DUF4926 domain-containing protein [Bacteroidota bacterium]MBU2584678.1 DUF4926 domain-containing protein [Bacteroidota bacterium]
MNDKIKIFDVVAVISDLPDIGLKQGQVGTVVESLGPNAFEVEFCDNNGKTYATSPLHSDQLLVLHYENLSAVA